MHLKKGRQADDDDDDDDNDNLGVRETSIVFKHVNELMSIKCDPGSEWKLSTGSGAGQHFLQRLTN